MSSPTDQEFFVVEDFLLVQRHEDLGRQGREFRVSDTDVSFKAAEECLFGLFAGCEELDSREKPFVSAGCPERYVCVYSQQARASPTS